MLIPSHVMCWGLGDNIYEDGFIAQPMASFDAFIVVAAAERPRPSSTA